MASGDHASTHTHIPVVCPSSSWEAVMTVKLTINKWNTGCRMISLLRSTNDHKRHWNREIYYSLVLQEVHSIVPGAIKGRSRQGAGRERSRIWGTYFYIKVTGKVPCSSHANANWSIQTRMSRVLASFTGEGPGRSGRLLITRAVGEVIPGTCIFLWLCGCYMGYSFTWGVSVSLRPPTGFFAKQNSCRGSNVMEEVR